MAMFVVMGVMFMMVMAVIVRVLVSIMIDRDCLAALQVRDRSMGVV